MEQFIKDILTKVGSYYGDLVAIAPKIIIGIVITSVFLLVATFLRKKFTAYLCRESHQQLLGGFLNTILRTTNIIFAIIIFMYILGRTGIAASIVGAAGVSAFVIGFAFKDIGENFLAGILLALNRPFDIGDTVKVKDIEGKVYGMTLRLTKLKTADGKNVFIPNAEVVKNPLYNYTSDGFIRDEVGFSLDKSVDFEYIKKLVEAQLKNIKGILVDHKAPKIMISDFDSNNVTFKVQYWIDITDSNFEASKIKTDLIKGIIKKFYDEEIYVYAENMA